VLFTIKQIQEFQRAGESFRRAYTHTEIMDEVYEDLKAAVLERLPAEERLRQLSAEERLRGISAEQVLAGLSHEELARLRALLDGGTKREE